ncbi:DUF3487 family protein [Vibrio agarivorans]|uniref:DUF3487 family protein n=1 Tax=Vibrio agarivorans TaxID=153622 RepID=A0ABT7Y7A9_9VIBR|nr:DUF3487 family protein [Vibrio agarivorans]MDN2483940.1 DUF3487 family protein [Vibrio agarivorans]
MSKAEQTNQVVLDQLDFAPNSIGGFTNAEFGACYTVCMIFWSLFLPIISRLVFGSSLIGFILSLGLALITTVMLSARAESLKRGRPSYMIWIDLMRKIQDEGLFGVPFLKYNFNLVPSAVWDNTKPEKDS